MGSAVHYIDVQPPQFFISQSERLTSLLNVVVHESKSTTSPEALVDYLELTGILTDLLDEARFFSMLNFDELQFRERDVQRCMERIRAVEEAIGDWNLRTKAAAPTDRKRARSIDSMEEDTMVAFKRLRKSGDEPVLAESISMGLPIVDVIPSIETSPTAWWTEPFYD